MHLTFSIYKILIQHQIQHGKDIIFRLYLRYNDLYAQQPYYIFQWCFPTSRALNDSINFSRPPRLATMAPNNIRTTRNPNALLSTHALNEVFRRLSERVLMRKRSYNFETSLYTRAEVYYEWSQRARAGEFALSTSYIFKCASERGLAFANFYGL